MVVPERSPLRRLDDAAIRRLNTQFGTGSTAGAKALLFFSIAATVVIGAALWVTGNLRLTLVVPALTMVIGYAVLLGAHVMADRRR